jgi:hypothetical protein
MPWVPLLVQMLLIIILEIRPRKIIFCQLKCLTQEKIFWAPSKYFVTILIRICWNQHLETYLETHLETYQALKVLIVRGNQGHWAEEHSQSNQLLNWNLENEKLINTSSRKHSDMAALPKCTYVLTKRHKPNMLLRKWISIGWANKE